LDTGTEKRESPKILIVDDEQDTVDMITTLLELEGYQAFSAASGAEAISFLERERQKTPEFEMPVDLILLDIVLKTLWLEKRKNIDMTVQVYT
jgi:CheY-like chemotaxis protein